MIENQFFKLFLVLFTGKLTSHLVGGKSSAKRQITQLSFIKVVNEEG